MTVEVAGAPSLPEIAALYAVVGRQVETIGDRAQRVASLLGMGSRLVPAADFVGLSSAARGSVRTLAATDDIVRRLDSVQREQHAGPLVQLGAASTAVVSGHVGSDARWPRFGSRAAAARINAVIAQRLFLARDRAPMVGLTLYSTRQQAFAKQDEWSVLVLATHLSGALVPTRATPSDDPVTALRRNREIGIAMGMIMAEHGLDREQSYAVLLVAAQHAQCRPSDIAVEIVDGRYPLVSVHR